MVNIPLRKRTIIVLVITALILNTASMDNTATADCRPAGSLVAWGNNDDGQCDIPDGNDFIAISGGGQHSLALRADGSLVAWGENASGQCDVPDGNDFVAVSAGRVHSIALRVNGTVDTWGSSPGLLPEAIDVNDEDFVAIATGWHHNLALKTAGSIIAWGHNLENQLDTVPIDNDFIAIAAGKHLSAAIRTDGSIVAWGHPNTIHNVPHGNNFIAITCGQYHGLALRADGTVAAWGDNWEGACDVPHRSLGNEVVAIATHNLTSMALKRDGSITVWGSMDGSLGEVPTSNDFVSIAAGMRHCLAIKDERLLCEDPNADISGPNDVPDGVIDEFDFNALAENWGKQAECVPTGSIVAWGPYENIRNHLPDGNDFVDVAWASGAHQIALALRVDGSIVAWGENDYGQCNVPDGDYIAIDIGDSYRPSCQALRRDGSLAAWGSNEHGMLNVPDGNDFVAIASSNDHALALRTDGSVVGWGSSPDHRVIPSGSYIAIDTGKHPSVGLREDGSVVTSGDGPFRYPQVNGFSSPAGNDFVMVTAGDYHCLALRDDGTVVGWGENMAGQLDIPHDALGHDVVAIHAKYYMSFALMSDGSIVAWGDWGHSGVSDTPTEPGFCAVDGCLAVKAEGVHYKPLVGDISGPNGEPDHVVNWYDWNAMVEAWKRQSSVNR